MEAIRKIIFRQEVKKIIRMMCWPGIKNANRKHAERLLNGYHRYDKHEKSGPDMEPPF